MDLMNCRVWAEKTHERIKRMAGGDSKTLDPVPVEILDNLIRTCLSSSIKTDEKRDVTFTLAVNEQPLLCNLCDQHGVPPFGGNFLALQEPRPLSPAELARLAPALIPNEQYIVVSTASPSCNIVGVLDVGPKPFQLFRGIWPGSCIVPRLSIWVIGKGSLRVFWCASEVLRVSELEEVTDSDLGRKWIDKWFTDYPGQIVNELSTLLADEHLDPERHPQFAAIQRYFLFVLVQEVLLARHGGTIVMIPDNLVGAEPVNVALKHKYKLKSSHPLEAVFEHRVWTEVSGAFQLQVNNNWVVPKRAFNFRGTSRDLYSNLRAEIDKNAVLLLHNGGTAARLACMDNALVVTNSMRVLSAGAEIVVPEQPDGCQTIRACDGTAQKEVSRENYGTRHRSVFRLVEKVPESLCVVCSSDGGAKVVRADSDGMPEYTLLDPYDFPK